MRLQARSSPWWWGGGGQAATAGQVLLYSALLDIRADRATTSTPLSAHPSTLAVRYTPTLPRDLIRLSHWAVSDSRLSRDTPN